MKTFHKFLPLLVLGLAFNLRAATNGAVEFSGTVVDAQGNPVANAGVACYQYASRMSSEGVDLEEKQHATTDAQGAFAFPTFEGMGYVVVTKAGAAPTWRTWYAAPLEPQKIVLSMPSVLAGVVADDAGRPVADAEVWVSSAINKIVSDIGQPNYMFGNVTRELFSTRTAADGTFRIENFPADAQAVLSVKIAGKALRQSSSPYQYDQLPFHAGQEDITLILDPAGSISGKVMESANGQPLAGAMIGLRPSGQGYSLLDEGTIISAADGSFQIPDVPAGSYQITAEFTNQPIPDWVVDPVPVTVAVGASTSGVQLQASKGGVLEVTVRDKTTHEPIAGASVNVYSTDDGRSGTTDSNGIAYVRSSPGTLQMGVNKQGWSQTQTQATVTDGQTTQVSVDLPEPLKISGIVRDDSGAPVSGANVTVVPDYGDRGRGAMTDANGHYNLSWEEPSWAGQSQQSFYLLVRDEGQKRATAQEISDGATNLDVTLKPAMSLSGSVRDSRGDAVTNAMVYIMLYEENSSFTVSRTPIPLDSQGRIHVEGLPLGERYGLYVSGTGYGTSRQEMDAADPKADHYDFPPLVVKIADRKLAGRVLGASGAPVAGAQVWLNGDGQPTGSATTDADGRFVFGAVCEGAVSINASLGNSNGFTQTTGGNTNIVIRMSENRPYIGGASQTLTGIVYDSSGYPSTSARVVVTPSMGQIDIAKTDDKGAYSVNWQAQPNMQGAKYFAIARDVDRNLAAIEGIKTSTKSVDLRLGPALTISGTVENADGSPLARANINLNMMAGNMGGLVEYGRIKMNSDGTFTIPALPMGQRYIVYATAEGHGSASKNISITQSSTNAIQLAPFKLKTADLELAGRILGADGKPLTGATLFLSGRDQPNGQVTSDENGHFEFKVCDGPVTIYAWSQSGNGRNDSANVDARGGDTNVVMKMGGPRQRRAATVVRQDPLIPQAWTFGAIIAWPAAHKTGMIVLLSLQAVVLLGTCAGIFLFTRKQS